MAVPNKREMREINERCPDMAAALTYWRGEAVRLGLNETLKAITRAMNVLGWEVHDRRTKFENSGRRPKNRGKR